MLVSDVAPLAPSDARLSVAIFTQRECAAYLGTPASTLGSWTSRSDGEPLVLTVPRVGRNAVVPFVGFAEAFVLTALRRAGVPMQRIRPAVQHLRREIGLEHALASRMLFTDGRELLYDYAVEGEASALTEVRTGQQQARQIVDTYLDAIRFGDDGWATALTLPNYQHAGVVVDPRVAFGLPTVAGNGARVEDIVDRFLADEDIDEIANDFELDRAAVEDVIRVATRAAS